MWVSPNYQETDFSWPLTTDDKIEIFLDRTYGWQLDIADQCINGKRSPEGDIIVQPIDHSGFAVLNIVLSYFEMIAKYQDGFTQHTKSEYYFKQGLYSVFPDLKKQSSTIADNLLDILYYGCRCGLYHGGMTDTSIVVTGETEFPLVFDSHELRLKINPHLLVPALKLHLAEYGAMLKDKTNTVLRQNHEKRFDFDALTRMGSEREARNGYYSTYRDKENRRVFALPDVLGEKPSVVFCNIGGRSSQSSGYYTDSRNRFWIVLFRIGLIPNTLSPKEYRTLPKYGIGLTELNKTSRFNNKSDSEYDLEGFRAKIEQYSPAVVAFNGKRAAQELYGYSVHYGLQPEPIGNSTVFVLPSTSGIARKYWNEWYWRELADYVKSRRTSGEWEVGSGE